MSQTDPNALQVVPVGDRRGRHDFIELPWAIYAGDPHWVPPLRIERRQALASAQPFSAHAEWQLFVVYRAGRVVGRISAQIDRLHLERYQDATGFFGFLDAIDDAEVFAALFDAAERWLADRGMRRVRGPFSLNVNQESGLLVSGFDSPPYLMMGHARPYYAERVQALGYVGVKDLLAYQVELPLLSPAPLEAMLKRYQDSITVRPFDSRRRLADLEVLRELFNDAWSENWSFVPFTEAEFQMVGKEMLILLPPDFIQIAEIAGRPVAFMAVMPNLNEAIADLNGRLLPFGWARLLWRLKVRLPKTVRVSLMGVRREYHHTRLGPTLAYAMIKFGLGPTMRRGVKRAELSWILEDNAGMRGIVDALGGRVSKRYRMYDKDLSKTSPMNTPTADRAASLPFVVLAGERPGGSPLAKAMQVAAGVLVPVAGETALARVFSALRASPSLHQGVLCGPLEVIVRDSAELHRLLSPGDIRWQAPAAGPAASTVAALQSLDRFPALVTTGDHALLTAAIVEDFLAAATAATADAVVGLVPYARVMAAFPGTRRTALRFQDQAYCGSNLFLLRTREGLKAALFWRQVEALRKRPWRIARHLGWWTLLRYLCGRLPIAAAMALLSQRAGCRVGYVELAEPRAAVDVDSVADRALAESILLADRSAAPAASRQASLG